MESRDGPSGVEGMRGRVLLVVEDAYAPHALRQVLGRRGLPLNRIIIVHLSVCNGKPICTGIRRSEGLWAPIAGV